MELEIVEFDPPATLDEVVSLLSVRAQAKGLALDLTTARTTCRARCAAIRAACARCCST